MGFAHVLQLKLCDGLHTYEPPPVADNVVVKPGFIVSLFPALTVGGILTLTVTTAVLLQLPFETVTVYTVFVRGETVAVGIAEPELQE